MKIKELFEEEQKYMKVSDIEKMNGKKILLKGQVRDIWDGDFALYKFGNKITSWEGIPKRINGYLNANSNSGLTSWEFAPEYAKKIYLDVSNISTLEGIPKSEDYSLLNGKMKNLNGIQNASFLTFGKFKNLSSFAGFPKEAVRYTTFWECPSLNFPLEPIGITIKNDLSFSECAGITNFKNVHKTISNCNRISVLDCENVKSNILGFLRIKNLNEIINARNHPNFDEAISIINKYLPNPTPDKIIDCQNELIEAGLEEYAEL